MQSGMVAAERTGVQPISITVASPPTLVCVHKELETARRVINNLAYTAYSQLDGEGMHDLATAEGLIAGALKKLEAAGVAS